MQKCLMIFLVVIGMTCTGLGIYFFMLEGEVSLQGPEKREITTRAGEEFTVVISLNNSSFLRSGRIVGCSVC